MGSSIAAMLACLYVFGRAEGSEIAAQNVAICREPPCGEGRVFPCPTKRQELPLRDSVCAETRAEQERSDRMLLRPEGARFGVEATAGE